jgi:type IV pilus assembly protein PilV
MKPVSRFPRASRGFTLIEALVALLALSIGLLGIAAMQMTGLRSNLSASWRSQATYLSYDIIDRIRANRDRRGEYVAGLGAPAGCATSAVCTRDIREWKQNLAQTLPGGDGTIAVNGTTVTVTVQWQDERGEDQDPLVFTTTSRI